MVAPLLAMAIPAVIEGGKALLGGLSGDKGGDKGGNGKTGLDAGAAKVVGDLLSGGGGPKSSSDHQATADQIKDATRSAVRAEIGKRHVMDAPLEQAISRLGLKQDAEPVQRHIEQASRAQVRRVEDAVIPQLQEQIQFLRQQALQTQATAEHRTLTADADWKRKVETQNRALLDKLASIERRMNRLRIPLDFPM